MFLRGRGDKCSQPRFPQLVDGTWVQEAFERGEYESYRSERAFQFAPAYHDCTTGILRCEVQRRWTNTRHGD